jgi:hypothetical protein
MTEISPKPASDIEFIRIRENVLVEVRRFEHHQHLITPPAARFRWYADRSDVDTPPADVSDLPPACRLC